MNRRLVVAMMLWAASAVSLLAQAPGVTLTDPVLKRAANRAEWTVFYNGDRGKTQETFGKEGSTIETSDVPDGASAVKSVTVSKDGNTYRETTQWGDGRTIEKWIVGDLQVYETPYSKQVARAILPTAGQYAENYSDYRRSDFEELEWLNKSNFRGLKTVGGRELLEFGIDADKRDLTPREISELINPDETKPTAELVKKRAAKMAGRPGYLAYLDPQTRLPVYFDDGQIVRIYKFSTPSGSLVVPPRFAEELEAWKKQTVRRILPKP